MVPAGLTAVPQPFKFVGQYGVMAEPNGFYYMRARYYDPSVGRFISEDPIGFEGGDVNLMVYVGNNPVLLAEFVAGTVPGPPPPTPMGYAGSGTAWLIQKLTNTSESYNAKRN